MSQISTARHDEKGLPSYESEDMLNSWELSAKFHSKTRALARFEDFSAADHFTPLVLPGQMMLPAAQAAKNHYHSSNEAIPVASQDSATILFDDFGASKHRQHNMQTQQLLLHAATEALAQQFLRECNLSNDPLDDINTNSLFTEIAAISGSSSSHNCCPDRPFHLMKTNISVKLRNTGEDVPIQTIIDLVDQRLSMLNDYDFSYFPASFLWKGKYLRGSSSSLIHVHLYKEKKIEDNSHIGYIIEANRISGDAKPFHEFFREFKALMVGGASAATPGLAAGSGCESFSSSYCGTSLPNSPLPRTTSFNQQDPDESDFLASLGSYPSSSSLNSTLNSASGVTTAPATLGGSRSKSSLSPPPPSLKRNHSFGSSSSAQPKSCSTASSVESPSICQQIKDSINPILNMTRSQFYEVKIEAAKMLCDISTSATECHESLLSDSHCVEMIFKSLENLILNNDGILSVKEQAIVAFTSFADTNNKDILNRILKSNILHILFHLISNPLNEQMTYETAQIRRESARLFTLLATHDIKTFANGLESQGINHSTLKKWYECIDELKDARTKAYAKRIRDMFNTHYSSSTTSALAHLSHHTKA
jgi:hypothetical protein